MKKALLCLVFLLAAVTPSLACDVTREQFFQKVEQLKPLMLKASDDAAARMSAFVNKNRAINGNEPLPFDEFYIGHFSDAGVPMAGLLAVNKGCVVGELTMVAPPEIVVQVLIQAGVSGDEFRQVPIGQDS